MLGIGLARLHVPPAEDSLALARNLTSLGVVSPTVPATERISSLSCAPIQRLAVLLLNLSESPNRKLERVSSLSDFALWPEFVIPYSLSLSVSALVSFHLGLVFVLL